jgi:hypothetical protein
VLCLFIGLLVADRFGMASCLRCARMNACVVSYIAHRCSLCALQLQRCSGCRACNPVHWQLGGKSSSRLGVCALPSATLSFC